MLVRICEEAVHMLGADYVNVLLGDPGEELGVAATWGLGPEVIGSPARQGSLAVPLRWDGEVRGALEVGSREPPSGDRRALLEAFAGLAAAACRNAGAHAGLASAARTDALTGCLNRAAMQDALERELERCRRTGHSLSLAIVDLDDFKQVNETHGHPAGDELLRRVGQALREAVRAYDVVARYGGDEFAIVAVDAGEREAAEVAGRAVHGLAGAVGATAGVAQWQPDEEPGALIARADRALLYGKQRGSRGVALRASQVPRDFVPAGGGRGRPPQDALSESSEARQSRSTLAS